MFPELLVLFINEVMPLSIGLLMIPYKVMFIIVIILALLSYLAFLFCSYIRRVILNNFKEEIRLKNHYILIILEKLDILIKLFYKNFGYYLLCTIFLLIIINCGTEV